MGENQATGKNFKPVVIAISVILAVIAVFFLVSSLLNNNSSVDPINGGSAFVNGQGDTGKITSTKNNTGNGSGNGNGNSTGKESSQSQDTANANKTKDNKSVKVENYPIIDPATRKDGSVLPAGSASKFIKGATATNRWSASSVISKVVAERIAVKLNVYDDNGVKTAQTKTRYLYVAEVTTKPSRVSVIAANQFTPNNIGGIKAIVKGYESATNQDILFASSNEMCARDTSNPLNNIFYNGNDTLSATVIKNGSIAQRGELSANSLTINKDGTWDFPVRVSMSTSEDLIKNGTIASVSYTYPVIWKGEKYNHPDVGVNTGIWTDHFIAAQQTGSNDNRTLIGKISDDKYVVLVSDGFGYGYMAEYMLNQLGVKDAYWGGGGIAATMYIKGYGVITPNSYVVHGDLFCIR